MNRILQFVILCGRGGNQNRLSQFLMTLLSMGAGLSILFLVALQRSDAADIYVTTNQDKISSTGGCSLKEAVYSANFDNNLAIDYVNADGTDHFITTQCIPGSGDDVIVLPPGAILAMTQITDDAHNPWGPSATPIIFSNITIDGYGAELGWDNGGSSLMARAFTVGYASVKLPDGTTALGFGNLTLNEIYIKGFTAKGGDGFDGGGGGLGAGGAVFVASSASPKGAGSLTVTYSAFDGNTAQGGNGSVGCIELPVENCFNGGGGGGMGGNGGHGQVDPLNSGGGGGGGARGNGGSGASGFAGGGGGGTVFSGGNGGSTAGGSAGLLCGGRGGDSSDEGNDGNGGSCPGGGAGGGGVAQASLNPFGTTAGGNGNIGGGGGGGPDQGGNGGWGGGGGSGSISGAGGNGGFGGGGGAGENPDPLNREYPGSGGPFGGSATGEFGGGGAGLGGAIFNLSGNVTIINSTFTLNDAVGGRSQAFTGEGHGGAIFSVDGSTTVENDTIDGNLASGSGGGIYIWQDSSLLDILGLANNTTTFILRNTIVANSGGSDDAVAYQCALNASVITGGDWRGNLIQSNDSCDYNSGSGTISSGDPLLGPLQNNGGYTPTMAIGENSPAWNTADATTSTTIDQRGSKRPELGGYDIGAYELCDIDPMVVCKPLQLCFFQSLTIGVSPAAGGTTTPSPGTTVQCLDSVVSLTAIPNPGYIFTGWSGNVSFPANASTVLVMAEPQSVTANFASCNCVVDVSAYVTVTRGPIVLNPITKRYAQTITVTNTSPTLVTGPIFLVLDGLSGNANLFNLAGTTDSVEPPAGSPYLSVNGSLAPGQMASFSLQFTNSTNGAISYSTRVLAGPGSI